MKCPSCGGTGIRKVRTLDQNSISHAWYQQLAKELPEDDALGWKSFCKLHFGVPILRTDDDEFRAAYDAVIKPMPYEQKLMAMRIMPVTSIMNRAQLSKYLVDMQANFISRGVQLLFPEKEAA